MYYIYDIYIYGRSVNNDHINIFMNHLHIQVVSLQLQHVIIDSLIKHHGAIDHYFPKFYQWNIHESIMELLIIHSSYDSS